ncbi:16228_t:CDS:10 [Entrophospora sp. SA101]|nr:23915_t:CDS:10 [Entrophospora sp. SA101]CAJ0768074.1 16228_t:CDS:10 [Entrophospora sp. SA101]
MDIKEPFTNNHANQQTNVNNYVKADENAVENRENDDDDDGTSSSTSSNCRSESSDSSITRVERNNLLLKGFTDSSSIDSTNNNTTTLLTTPKKPRVKVSANNIISDFSSLGVYSQNQQQSHQYNSKKFSSMRSDLSWGSDSGITRANNKIKNKILNKKSIVKDDRCDDNDQYEELNYYYKNHPKLNNNVNEWADKNDYYMPESHSEITTNTRDSSSSISTSTSPRPFEIEDLLKLSLNPKVQRKFLDLQISNKSLLNINTTLESTIKEQNNKLATIPSFESIMAQQQKQLEHLTKVEELMLKLTTKMSEQDNEIKALKNQLLEKNGEESRNAVDNQPLQVGSYNLNIIYFVIKLLWVKQQYPDNYYDETFLEELEKNVNVRTYDYWTVVMESSAISQHISSIVIFIAVFKYLDLKMLSSQSLIIIGSVFTFIGYIFWDKSISKTDPSYEYKRWKTAKGAILFFATLLGLSPILKTLTIDTSEDTIWALTVILFLANMMFHDYGSENRTNIKFPGSLSTNAAIFASVLLASRLTLNSHVFGLMLFAVEWFALFPIFRRYIKV